MSITAKSSASFLNWQQSYAERGIATFPVGDDKVPAIRGYQRVGQRGSGELARKFPDAPAIGFMCGPRSGITVLDIDTNDEQVVADAVERHGNTPIVARTGSGNFQAWYRHGGERRLIRPRRDVPIDILGGGFVVAPPSKVAKGNYQFIQGSLDDLSSLPTLNDAPAFAPVASDDWATMRDGDGRNDALFRLVARAAHHCDDFEQVLDYARTQNEQFGEPMQDIRVISTAKSVWKMTTEGRNRFGQFGAYVPLELSRKLARSNPDAYALYGVLKAENGPESVFPIANAMAETVINFGWRRLRHARKLIVGLGLVEEVSPQTRHKPALYRWPDPKRSKDSKRS